jgi:hypothetical protein
MSERKRTKNRTEFSCSVCVWSLLDACVQRGRVKGTDRQINHYHEHGQKQTTFFMKWDRMMNAQRKKTMVRGDQSTKCILLEILSRVSKW